MTDPIKKRRTLEGVVVSDKMTSSIVIETARLVPHKLYGKMIRRHKKYMADDPENICTIGDQVIIEECRPLSKNKRWRLREIVKKAD
ncbi:MAG: 30S ribosomal protein S17 [Proteobacteria bacterium]|nr:30S ribosomal protein S17 [Desulfobulbaceae bacterium]MBU4154435.1 30S ribosomal protein S17 [Pseudomonadota bacterium]MDP2107080.1 30S ribosomal protein S17 [Desulfobulbaceae bacterium]